MPTVAASAELEVANHPAGGRRLGPPEEYLRGRWADRDWRNVPGPFYGARTDSSWVGRVVAPGHVVYEDKFGSEIVYRQPRTASEVHLVLTAAWNDPFGAYAADGDEHWTLDLVRDWWADRDRLAAWIDDVQRRWSCSERADERDNAAGLRDFAGYLTDGLEADLRDYGFWLDNRRPPRPHETLPHLGRAPGSVAGSRPDVRIVQLNGPAFRALARGDLAAAETVSPVALSPYLAGPECRALWRMRSEQCEQDPSSADWVTGIVWDERQCVAVGAAGFHGPPDGSGMVEIGYRIDPGYRRRGYARAALEALLARAAREPDVHRVRVSIRPDNLPSSRLALQYGFRQVGEQWDDEDGLELVYEVVSGRETGGPTTW
jgi:RimJ/RimL family protein N-acetyltransferase